MLQILIEMILLNYIDQNYNVNNFCIIASGAVEHNKIVNMLKNILQESKQLNQKEENFTQNNQIENNYSYKDINQAHLIIGGTTFGYNKKERALSNVISNILGEGSSSRLFQSLREKNGIAYQINSFMNSF